MVEIELADAVAAIRDELVVAVARGVDAAVGFVVGPIELEFAVELRRDSSVQAGFKAWVLSADASVGSGQVNAQRVKVTLTPRLAAGGDLQVSAGQADDAAGAGRDDVSGYQGR